MPYNPNDKQPELPIDEGRRMWQARDADPEEDDDFDDSPWDDGDDPWDDDEDDDWDEEDDYNNSIADDDR